MKTLDIVTFVLLVIGGVNWGIVGISGNRLDLVRDTIGAASMGLAWFVYILVGLSAIVQIALWKPAHMRLYKHEHEERRVTA